MTKVTMTVNGKSVSGEAEGRTLLSTFIRENLRLTGTHVGCDTAQCGACTVHVNGRSVKSCNMFAAQGQPQADGARGARLPHRQPVPLHGLPQHRQGDHGRVRAGRFGRRGGMISA